MGDYSVHITPESMRGCIIAHAPIVDEGHIIIETKIETIIRDVAGQYELRFPKDPMDSPCRHPTATHQVPTQLPIGSWRGSDNVATA